MDEKEKIQKTQIANAFLSKVGTYILVVVMAAMVIMVFVNAVARYAFNTSFPATEELARYGFVWVSFLGAIVAFVSGGHVGVDLVICRLHGKAKLIVRAIGEIIVFLVIFVIARGGWAYFTQTYLNKSQGTGLPFGVVSVVPLVLVVFIIITEIKRIKEHINEYKNERENKTEEVN